MRKCILIGAIFHETHTFLDGTTGLRDFFVRRGDAMLECAGDSSPLGGVLESARAFGWQVVPTADFRASPSAIVEDSVVENFWEEFRTRATPALREGIDAIYLVLHGAMVSQSFADVEGELLERVRRLPGAAELPIFGVFDLHANFTRRMADHADCLVAYRENPHTDGRRSAVDAAALLERALNSRQRPRTFWAHPPIMWPPTGTGTASDPMRALEAHARALENNFPNSGTSASSPVFRSPTHRTPA